MKKAKQMKPSNNNTNTTAPKASEKKSHIRLVKANPVGLRPGSPCVPLEVQ